MVTERDCVTGSGEVEYIKKQKMRHKMKVRCPHCYKLYNMPDDALPQGKRISFHCKKCNGLVRIDPRSKTQKELFPRLSRAKKAEKKQAPPPAEQETETKPMGRDLRKKILQILMGRLPVMP